MAADDNDNNCADLVAAAKALDAEVAALRAEINELNSKLGKLCWARDRAWDAADGVVPGGIPRDMTYLYEIHARKD